MWQALTVMPAENNTHLLIRCKYFSSLLNEIWKLQGLGFDTILIRDSIYIAIYVYCDSTSIEIPHYDLLQLLFTFLTIEYGKNLNYTLLETVYYKAYFYKQWTSHVSQCFWPLFQQHNVLLKEVVNKLMVLLISVKHFVTLIH